MDAHKAFINTIFTPMTLLEVPFFQRSYVWGEDLWSRFIDDMYYIVDTKKPHFFGSIILKEAAITEPDAKYASKKTIVDGQQRLTTFMLFWKVLCLKLNEPNSFEIQFRSSGDYLALRHGRNDIEAFEKVLSATTLSLVEEPASGSNIIKAFNYFINNIDESRLELMPIISNAQFVHIDLNENEDEQQIFDTINSLGVNLTTSELLKNYFFSRETVAEYEDKWESVFEKDDETKAYWDTQIEAGRTKRALIDIFFDAYFTVITANRKYNISSEDRIMYRRLDKLAQSYHHFINNYCDGNKDIILRDMKEYALCFLETFKPDQCRKSIPSSFGIERLNVVIFGLKNTTLIPYVLFIAKNASNTDERNWMYGLIESYIMRRMVVHATTKNYNGLMTSLIANQVLDAKALSYRLLKGEDSTTYWPSDDDVFNGFVTSKLINLQTKGIIYLIEASVRPSSSSTALLGFDNYSLEHLMPKKWRNNWDALPSEDAARNRDSKLLTLGNLGIITQSLNSSIRDATWLNKKKGNGPSKPGLELCAGGVATLHDVLLKDIWDEEGIDERGKWLAEKAIRLWAIQ